MEILEEKNPSNNKSYKSISKSTYTISNQEALKLKNEGIKLTEEKIYFDAISKFEEALRVCEEDYPEKYSLLWWVI